MGFRQKCEKYGGFFLSEKEAEEAIPFECPPVEILDAYAFGTRWSRSKVDIVKILPRIYKHLPHCTNPKARCYDYVFNLMARRSGLSKK